MNKPLLVIAGPTASGKTEIAVLVAERLNGEILNDLPALRFAGVAVAPANAVAEVKQMAHYVTLSNGGQGAVREVCSALLRAHGAIGNAISFYDNVTEGWGRN